MEGKGESKVYEKTENKGVLIRFSEYQGEEERRQSGRKKVEKTGMKIQRGSYEMTILD